MLCMTIFMASRVPGVGNPRERVATSVSEGLHASGVDTRGPVHLLGNAVEEKMIQRLAVCLGTDSRRCTACGGKQSCCPGEVRCFFL